MNSKLIERFYLSFFIVLPLLFYTKIVDAVLLPRQLFLGLFLTATLVFVLARKEFLKYNLLKNKVFWAYLVFLLFNFLSLFQSEALSESHAVFARIILIFLFFTLTSFLLLNDFITEKKIIISILIFGVLSLLPPIYQIIEKTIRGQHLLSQVDQIAGNFGNKNLLSSILFLCLPFFFLGLYYDKKIKTLSYFLIATTLFVLLVIRTRIVIIAIIVFFILLLCFYLKQKYSIKKRVFAWFGLLITGVLIASYKFYFETIFSKLTSSPDRITHYFYRVLDSETLKTRLLFWKNSIEMFQEHPFLGVGIGNWQIYFPKYGLNNFKVIEIVNGQSSLQRPHNDFVWILCETGIIGLISYLVLFGIVFYQLYYLIKKAPNVIEKWKFFYLFSGLVGYILISFFDFPYERIEHQVLLVLIIAIVASSYQKTNSKTNTSDNSKLWLFLLLIPLGYALIITFFRFNGERNTNKMYHSKAVENWEETITNAKNAENYFFKLDNASIPIKWYEGIAYFNKNQIEESEACFLEAYQLNPYNIHVINNLASVYQVNGKSSEAILLYEDALKISNKFDEATLNLAALYFNKKEFEKAFSLINEVDVATENAKYKTYLVPILNQKINSFLKTCTNKELANGLAKKITTSAQLLQLYFDSKKTNLGFENYLETLKN